MRFEDHDITRMKPYQIARLGLARTFQIVQPFPKMTVVENVAAGALFCGHAGNVREAHTIAREHLAFTGLADLADRPAASLTLARRKRLELAKSLAMRPRLLMLDEVNAGFNPTEIEEALGIIRRIAEQGVTIIVIEHLMKVVLSISHRVVVLHHGQLIAQGAPRDVIRRQERDRGLSRRQIRSRRAGRPCLSAADEETSRLRTCRPATATCRCCGM